MAGMARCLGVVVALHAAAAGGAAAAAVGGAGAAARERPVMKVVRLLQDMQAELQRDLADDRAVHEQLDCWCKENDREKTKAIAVGEAKESELEAFLGEAAAKMAELKTKRDSTRDEADRDFDSLSEASALRMKDNKAYQGESADLIEAIKACDQALTVLGEYNYKTDFPQVRSVAQRLQHARVLALGQRSRATPAQMLALRAFLAKAQGGTSFLAIPGYQSYAPQSGQIFGVLEQMKEDFEKDLSDSESKEKTAVGEFKQLKVAKEEEIDAGRQLVVQLDQEIAELKAKHAEAFKELEDTQAQLELDRTFLANLKKKCSESDAEFDARVKSRLEEIAAVEDTIGILNTDEAFDNFDKTVNTMFLQASAQVAHRESQQQQQRLRRVAASLEQAAARTGAPQLALLAAKARLDAFTKVKEEIDKMVAELSKQQEDEIAHRDWCIDELAKNKRSTEAAYDKKESLLAKIADLEKTIDYLTKEIEAATAAVAEMQEQMKRASENREAENADYQQTVTDQRLTQMILQKALARMKEVYAFLQQQRQGASEPEKPGAPHIQTSGTHTDPGNGPARFTKYEQNAGGSRVVRMLQEVIADSRKTEDEAIASEQDAQTAYENFMKDSNKGITAYTKKIMHMKGAKAKAEEDLTMAESDLKATMGTLEELHATLGDIKASCDYILKNFDARQAARAAEIDALGEAKAILSGAK